MKLFLSIKNTYFLAALCVYAYLLARAIYVPPVHDECATYFLYVIRDEWMPLQSHMDANNHILNSFLSAQIFKIFGQGTLYLRMASLLFFPVFVFYAYRISKYIHTKHLQALFLVSVLLVHNLVEYFAYSRGYAMSMALMMGSIYYVLAYLKDFSLKKLAPFYLFSTLAIISNLTLINTILILNGFLFLSFFLYRKQWLLKILLVFIGMLPIVWAGYVSMEMKKIGLLYYGSSLGFWEVTVQSMSELLYGKKQVFTGFILAFWALLGCIFLLMGRFGEGWKRILFTPRYLFGILLLGNVAATILLQKILHVNYPEDRTAMYFYFLLAGFFFFSLDHIPVSKIKYLGYLWLIVPLHSLLSVNMTHSAYWYYEHIPMSFYKEIEKRAGDHPATVSIGGYNLMDLIWSYYNQQNGGKMNDMQTVDYPSFYYDYLLLYEDNNYAYAMDYYNDIAEDPYSHIHLLERKKQPVLIPLTEYTLPDFKNEASEYTILFENDSLKKYPNLGFEINTNIEHTHRFLFGMFCLSTWIYGEEKTYERQELHYLKTSWRNISNFNHGLFVQKVSPETDRIVLYFWNPRKIPVNLTGTKINIYTWN